MLIDLVLGILLAFIAYICELPLWQCSLVLLSIFVLDGDIVINEFVRKFIKGEKDRFLSLDEYSYTHKFILHLPFLVLPLSFAVGFFLQGISLALLLTIAMFLHLVHDSVDKNFDGVRWLWPFNSISYKWHVDFEQNASSTDSFYLVINLEGATAQDLKQQADELNKDARDTKGILKDNIT